LRSKKWKQEMLKNLIESVKELAEELENLKSIFCEKM